MLQIKNLHYSIGERELLREVEWIINPGRRIGLIGKNGAGKTTLLRILAGEIDPDEGQILMPGDYRIGYLPQEEMSLESDTLLKIVRKGHSETASLEARIAALRERLHGVEHPSEELLRQLGSLEDQYRTHGGYHIATQAKRILSGLGFSETDFQRDIEEFSGGWRMRAYLAQLLLQGPDLLLLDEPTNHLDLESLEWLEQYLTGFPGSIVFVSHDRYFIDRMAQEICEIDRATVTIYKGNYSFYESEKELAMEKLHKRWMELREERERIQRFIDRFRYKNTKAAQVQSRIKQLEKMEKVEIPPPPRRLRFQIRVETPSYKDVLKIRELAFRYDAEPVLQGVELSLYRGDKIALVGVNGAGKTTLTRLIMGEFAPQKGSITLGERVVPGYYAQHQVEALDLDNTIMQEVAETAAEKYRTMLRDVLGLFNFSGDEVDKRIGILSGGEKARVSLAKILLSPVNFLIMDEPTNHLDLNARQALETALEGYDGTLLLISHDRRFLDRLVDGVVELKDGRLAVYEGGYSEYLERRAARDPVSEDESRPADSASAVSGRKSREQKREEAEARQAISTERRRLEETIARCEKEIARLEETQSKLESRMADPASFRNGHEAARLQREYHDVKAQLESLLSEWEAAQRAHEQLMARIAAQK